MSSRLKHKQKCVCQITTIHSLHNDSRVFYRQCCSLAKAGYETHLVIPFEAETVKDGVHIHPCPRLRNRLLHMLITPWLAMRLALKTHADIYHYHDPELMFIGFILRFIFRKNVVYDIHESVHRQILSKSYLPRLTRRLVSVCYVLLEKIFTVGQSLVIANENCLSEYSSNACLVQNYPMLTDETIAIADNNKTKARPPLLVYVGAVSEIRGVGVCVELAGALAKHGYDFRMKLIGPYQDSEDSNRKLKSRIEVLQLQDKVELTGRMEWTKAMEIVSQATIGMCLLLPEPNHTTCLATKILEYMMYGTPVLASDFDHWRKYVEGEKTGVMVDPENIEDVTDACLKMLANPDQLERMGKRGRAAVREKYNWDTEFSELLRCYDNLLQ